MFKIVISFLIIFSFSSFAGKKVEKSEKRRGKVITRTHDTEEDEGVKKEEAKSFYELAMKFKQQKQTTEALKYFKKSAERGHMIAQYFMGNINLYGQYGQGKHEKQAIKWYTKSAEQGYKPSMERLAYCLGRGIGCKVNPGKAAYWNKKYKAVTK